MASQAKVVAPNSDLALYTPYTCQSIKCDERADLLLQQILQTAETLKLAQSLQESLNIRVFTRMTPSDEVASTHATWSEELSRSFSLPALELDIKDLCERILQIQAQVVLEKSKESALCVAFQKMQLVDQHFSSIKQENELLKILLTSSAINRALILYKETIDACEKIKSGKSTTPLKKLSDFGELFQASYKRLLEYRRDIPRIRLTRIELEEIQSLHIQTLEFLCNFLALFEKKHPAAKFELLPVLQKSAEEALQECKKPEHYKLQPVVPAQVLVPNGAAFAEKTKSYLQACQEVTLPIELRYEEASWMKEFYIQLTIDTSVLAIVGVLTAQAKALHCIHVAIQRCVDNLSLAITPRRSEAVGLSTDPSFYCQLLVTIQEELKKQKHSLHSLEMTKEVVAGLNYCNGLTVFSAQISRKLDYYSRLSKPKYCDVFEVEKNLFSFLEDLAHAEPKDPTWKLKTIYDLFCVAHSHRRLPPTADNLPAHPSDPVANQRARILNAIEPMIAKYGKIAFSQIIPEDGLWNKIIQQKPLEISAPQAKELPLNVRLFLAVEITRAIYFPDGKENNRLDLALFLLDHVPIYQSLYTESKKANLHLASMITMYQSRPKRHALPEPFYIDLAEIFVLMHKTLQSPSINIENIFRYAEACERICLSRLTINGNGTLGPEAKAHAFQLLGSAEEVRKEIIQKQSLPEPVLYNSINPTLQQLSKDADADKIAADTFTNLLFTYLARALYGKGEDKEEAENIVHEYLSTRLPPKFKMPQTFLVKYLIPEFVMRRLLENKKLCSFEESNLREQLYLCLIDQENLDLYNRMHSAASLELALFVLIENEQSKPQTVSAENSFSLVAQFQQQRDKDYFEEWKKQMSKYKEWRFAPVHLRAGIAQRIIEDLKRAKNQPSIHPQYKAALEACYQDLVT